MQCDEEDMEIRSRKNDNKKINTVGTGKLLGGGWGGGKYFYLLNIKPKHHHT